MKLQIFHRLNTLSDNTRTGERTIRIHTKGNILRLSRQLCKDLNLKPGDGVLFAQDETNKKHWFLTIAEPKDETAFILRTSSGTTVFTGRGLIQLILTYFNSKKPIVFLVAKEGQTIEEKQYFQLIPINTEKSKK